MKFYFASGTTEENMMMLEGKNVLMSYFYILQYKNYLWDVRYKEKYKFKSFFLDSGAYSCLTQNKFIHPENYAWYIKNNMSDIDIFANLDYIGNDEKTLKNQKIIEEFLIKQGITDRKPMPVFHFTDLSYLDYYCKNYEIVGIGGIAPLGKAKEQLIKMLEEVFNRYPNHKFHAFGLAGKELMERYNWYSCDSSTFQQANNYGEIETVDFGRINVGKNKTDIKEHKLTFLKDKCALYNIDYELLLHDNATARLKFNIEVIQELVNKINEKKGCYEDIIPFKAKKIDFELIEQKRIEEEEKIKSMLEEEQKREGKRQEAKILNGGIQPKVKVLDEEITEWKKKPAQQQLNYW